MAAAQELKSSYCSLAHGGVLAREFFSEAEVAEMAGDPTKSNLTDAERAIMRFAAKVARDAASIDCADVEDLRSHGLSEAEIFDVVAAAAARCFFSKALDALGTQLDAAYGAHGEAFKAAMTVGRAIETGNDD